ncbi:COG4223 family protein [Hyphomonas sp. NPDC076900]|uniref:COG4223 family protein n=1 Tax=unclassified Hyphomonas TaxID=2630699 RepID=UPI003D043645
MTDTSPPGHEPHAEPIDAHFEPAPDPLPAKAKATGPGWGGVAVAAIAAALLGTAGGIFGRDLILPQTSAALEQQLADLTAQQAEFERRLTEMPEASDELSSLIGEVSSNSRKLNELLASGAGIPAVESLTARIEALERIEPGEGATPAEALRTITALEARLSAMEQAAAIAAAAPVAAPEPQAEPEKDRQAEAALALSAIESAARRGTGFEADYRALRAAAPGNQTVRRLAPYVSGVPTTSKLQADFTAMRAAVTAAGKTDAAADQPQSQLSWLNRVFGDAVTVRPANKRENPVVTTLDTASKALAAGDLPASVKALATLEGNAARAAQDWTREANRRITLEGVLEDVRLSLIEPEN